MSAHEDYMSDIDRGREAAMDAKHVVRTAAKIAYQRNWTELHHRAMLAMETLDDLAHGFAVKEDVEGERQRAEMPSQQIPSPWRPRVIRGGG